MQSDSPRTRPSCRWRFPEPIDLPPPIAGVHPLVQTILARRGVTEVAEVTAFLAPAPPDDNPFILAGMREAVNRLRSAMATGEQIAVFGDYDADGVAGTAILAETLTALGGVVTTVLPHRERDGYGLSSDAVRRLAADGAKLLVTVDCGIRSPQEVDEARALGLEVIITDHHSVSMPLPEALAIVNPKRPDCPSGMVELSGAGLAFKLAQALLRAERQDPLGRSSLNGALSDEDREASLMALAAIGTVADAVPLVGANRHLVHAGLAELRRGRRPGLAALAERARLDLATANADSIGFVLAPRINAAGRMGDATRALELLLATDRGEARRLAAVLDLANDDRRQATAEAMRQAESALAGDGHEPSPFLMFTSAELPLGVMGLVAARLTDKHYRPAAALRLEGNLARGSARSIPEFDVTAALDRLAHLMVKHGGHARAAGFTVEVDKLGELHQALNREAADQLAGQDLRPELGVAAQVVPAELKWDLHDALAQLEPYGEGNPKPYLHLSRARIGNPRIVGERHLRFAVITPNGPIDAIAFSHGPRFTAGRQPIQLDRADLVFRLQSNSWNGGPPKLELVVEDLIEVD